MFADLRQHGNTSWTYALLLRTSLMWMVSQQRTWRARYEEVARLWTDADHDLTSRTFEGFLKAVRREHRIMLDRLTLRLQRRMLQLPPPTRQIAGRDVYAVDGTSLELPRTRENQQSFCGSNVDPEARGQPGQVWRQTPQLHLTTVWHVGLRLPWAWRTGPGDASERNDLRELAKSLPRGAVLTADAGFVGYDLWEAMRTQGVDFVIRVGSNVALIEGLEPVADRDDVVSFWPQAARREGRPPRPLRLVRTKLGDTQACLATSVLDPQELSDADVVAIYRARWGVEVFYRGLKQTFARRRLTGRTPDAALAEVDLSLHALWLIHLLGLQASPPASAAAPPLSTAKLLDAVRTALARPDDRPPPDRTLAARLRQAHVDQYLRRRPKHSRHYPRKMTPGKCGLPTIRPPLRVELNKLQSLIHDEHYRRNQI
jgi:Transposase DDE domain